MRLLASTGPLFGRPMDWAFGVCAEAGFDGVELMVTRDPATQDPARITAAAAAEGVEVPVVHGPFLLLSRRVMGTDLVLKAHRSLELTDDIGAGLLVVHPPLRWQLGFHRWLLDRSDIEAEKRGIRLAVENLYPVSLSQRSVRFHRYTAPEHLLPFRHVVLDTSHFDVAGVDINDAYALLRDRTAHLHLSDNHGRGRDSHAPLGEGRLPLARFLRTIDADARAGRGRVGTGEVSITLEVNCRRHLNDRAALVDDLRRERLKCQALLDGAPAEEVLGRPDAVATEPEVHDHGAAPGTATLPTGAPPCAT